jgi:thiol:disulfide interchange protein DsbD
MFFLFPILLTLSALLTAQPQERMARVDLISPVTQVAPGDEVPVGVRFRMKPGWHIYWINPGDAGTAPQFNWDLPGGGVGGMMRGGEWDISRPAFPTPVRFVDGGGLVGYGYDDTVIFPFTLRVPGSATPGQEVTVTLRTDYLICEKICLSEQAQASMTFRVGRRGEVDRESQAQLDEAARALPVAAAQSRLVQDVTVNSAADLGERVLTAVLSEDVEDFGFFPQPPTGVVVEGIDVVRDGRRVRVTFRPRAMAGAAVRQSSFPAVLGFTTPEGRRGVSVNILLGDPVDE